MANSTTHLDLVSASQSNKEITVNAALDAASPAMLYGRRASTTSGLTFGYYGGNLSVAGEPVAIANGTVTLTASATNYVEANATTGAVTVNTTAFTSGAIKLYEIVTGATTVTSYTDKRCGGAGGGGSGSGFTQEDADLLYEPIGAASSAIYTHLAASNPHPEYLTQAEADALYAVKTQPLVAVPFYPGVPTASALMMLFPAPAGITTLTFAAAMAGSSGKALVAATAQTDFDVRKNATSAATGTSVGTMRFAAGATVPTFIAASGFTLTGGADWLTVWAPATPDATLANIGAALYCTRS